MPEIKVQGKFYPLQKQEWLKACKELKYAEMQVLYYIRTIDPYNNSFQISAAHIAKELSTEEKRVHRQTVSRALKSLESKGFIEFELIKVEVTINPKGYWCNNCTSTVSPHTTPDLQTPDVISTHHKESVDTAGCVETPQGVCRHHAQPETLTQQEVESPKINKTYKTFKDSLSQEEKESFERFGKKKASELPLAPTLPLKWIERHWKELRDEWYKQTGKTPSTTAHDWENDPRTSQWMVEIEKVGYAGIFYCPMDTNKVDEEKLSFYNWAIEIKRAQIRAEIEEEENDI